jgi:enamine deaminase RidA (YjgF/YER057c/UK114 family)
MQITRYESTGRLSKVVVANGVAYLSGLTAKDRGAGIREQTADVLAQIDGFLGLAGTAKSKLLKVNIWLRDLSDFAEMNAAWDAWIDPEEAPARATVQSSLADGILVEIMAEALV